MKKKERELSPFERWTKEMNAAKIAKEKELAEKREKDKGPAIWDRLGRRVKNGDIFFYCDESGHVRMCLATIISKTGEGWYSELYTDILSKQVSSGEFFHVRGNLYTTRETFDFSKLQGRSLFIVGNPFLDATCYARNIYSKLW